MFTPEHLHPCLLTDTSEANTLCICIVPPFSAVAPLTYYVNRDAFIKRKSSDIISGSGL